MTELKPCPFCGKEARLIDAECGTTIYAVECVLCQAKIGWFDEKERAIEAWNKRENPWHTGTPTDLDCKYLCKIKGDEETYVVMAWNGVWWRVCATTTLISEEEVVEWQKIEPYKKKEDASTKNKR